MNKIARLLVLRLKAPSGGGLSAEMHGPFGSETPAVGSSLFFPVGGENDFNGFQIIAVGWGVPVENVSGAQEGNIVRRTFLLCR